MAMASSSPVVVEFEAPEQVKNWRPLVQWILAIPHLIISRALGFVSGVLWIVTFFAILFTEKIPEGVFNLQVMIIRYQTRVAMYAGFMHEQYPKFEFTMSANEPGGDPLRLSIPPQADLNRWLPLVKWFLAIPHYVMIVIYGIAAFVLWFVNFFIILFTGKWNVQHRNFIVKFLRYCLKVQAYIFLLRDDYPSFTLV